MDPIVIVLAALGLLWLGAAIWSIIVAFRVHLGWGLAMIFVPLAPLVFLVLHWRVARVPGLIALTCGIFIGGIIGSQPAFVADLKAKLAAQQKGRGTGQPAAPTPPGPRVAHDLAAAENRAAAGPGVDPNAAPRAAYARHQAELTATYQQLAQERAALKSDKATAAFNAKAARYQEALKTLAAEKARLDALDQSAHGPVGAAANAPAAASVPATVVPGGQVHAAASSPAATWGSGRAGGPVPAAGSAAPSEAEAEAAAALDQLRSLAGTGEYVRFADLLKKRLADDRQSSVFPKLVALGRQTLPNATPERLSAAVQRQTEAARTETEAVTQQIKGIVNQTPRAVPRPPPGAEVYHYDFHPGASKPDFNAADLLSSREPWKGDFVYIEHVPGVYYRAQECEFNAQTKYFYTSRDVPKKKLSENEYRELTRLYRVLGRDERIIAAQGERLAEVSRAASELLALNTQLASLAGR